MQVQINDNDRTIKLIKDDLDIVTINRNKQMSIANRLKIEIQTHL